ncbi:hypothetical protein [Streptomyces sp. NPDC059564]|uniref:hypothetical protein n=1 Tax=Streptomyces sp. NPDC059564 TaxID=3346865 RepID=UPI0036BC378C
MTMLLDTSDETTGPESDPAKTAFRNQLLPLTVANALKVPFYRHHWAGCRTEAVERSEDLALLPTIDKSVLLARPHRERLHPELAPEVFTHTTGTTGHPFIRARSGVEIAAFKEHVAILQEVESARSGRPTLAPVTFSAVPATVHGAFASTGLRLNVDVFTAAGLDKTIGLLLRDDLAPGDHERHLIGSPGGLLLLTRALRQLGLDPAALRLDRIVNLTDLLLPGQQALLRSAWPGTPLVNRFSLSEVSCGATECTECGAFHFDPVALPEVLDLDTGVPVPSGTGELTATELYPFAQLQPMIRYRTGDLVERIASPCDPGEVSVRLVGRRATTPLATVDGRTVAVISPVALAVGAELMPELERYPLGRPGTPGAEIRQGRPLIKVAGRAEGAVVHLELRAAPAFDPDLFPQRARNLVAELTDLVERLTDPQIPRTALRLDVRLATAGDFNREGGR